jgi:hypothetical protein
MSAKDAKLPEKKSNGHTINQLVIKNIKIFHSKASQNVPKLGVWFGNKPSGNPGPEASFPHFGFFKNGWKSGLPDESVKKITQNVPSPLKKLICT